MTLDPRLLLDRRRSVVGVLVAVVVVLGLGVLAGADALVRLDHAVAVSLFDWTSQRPGLAHTAIVVQAMFSLWPMTAYAVVAVALLVARGHARSAGGVALTMTSSTLLDDLVKLAVARPRPTWTDPIVTLGSPSFPSGHSCAIAAAATLVVLVTDRLAGTRTARLAAAVAIALAVVVGADRLLLGVHYLSDVVGGYALGVATALVCTAAVRERPSVDAAHVH